MSKYLQWARFRSVVGNLCEPARRGPIVGLLAIFRAPRAIRLYKVLLGRMLAANKKQAHANNNNNFPFDALRVKRSNSFSPGSTWIQKHNLLYHAQKRVPCVQCRTQDLAKGEGGTTGGLGVKLPEASRQQFLWFSHKKHLF